MRTGRLFPSSNVSGYSTLHTEIALISSGDRIPNWIVRGLLMGLHASKSLVEGKSATRHFLLSRMQECGSDEWVRLTEQNERIHDPTWLIKGLRVFEGWRERVSRFVAIRLISGVDVFRGCLQWLKSRWSIQLERRECEGLRGRVRLWGVGREGQARGEAWTVD